MQIFLKKIIVVVSLLNKIYKKPLELTNFIQGYICNFEKQTKIITIKKSKIVAYELNLRKGPWIYLYAIIIPLSSLPSQKEESSSILASMEACSLGLRFWIEGSLRSRRKPAMQADTRGRHWISAELKRLELEARFLEVIPLFFFFDFLVNFWNDWRSSVKYMFIWSSSMHDKCWCICGFFSPFEFLVIFLAKNLKSWGLLIHF